MAFTLGIENKEYLQAEDFYLYVSSKPGITRDDARLVDEIRWFMQTQNTVDLLTCLDGKVHVEPGIPNIKKEYCGNSRVNFRPGPLIYPDMTAAQARFFVKKFESLHPEITKKIKDDLGSHEMHKPISSSVATIAMFASDTNCTELSNQIKVHKFQDKDEFKKALYVQDLNIPSPVSMVLRQQQFPELNELVEKMHASTNAVFNSGLPKRTYGKVMAYDPSIAHGLLLNNDAAKPDRVKAAIEAIIKGLKDQFGDRVKLMDQVTPLITRYKEDKISLFLKLDVEGKSTTVDPLGSKPSSSMVPNKILYAYVERFVDDNVSGKYIQD